MRKVNCEACGATYEVDPRRVPATGMKMRCPACGASVHVAPEAAQPGAKPGLGELDFDLPAPKPRGAPRPQSLPTVPTLPPVKLPAELSAKLPEPDLSDLPAVKAKLAPHPSLSSSAADDLTDLPVFKPMPTKAGLGMPSAGEPRASLPKAGLPTPSFEPYASLPTYSGKKTEPAKLRPVEQIGSIDLVSDLDLEIDLPAPKAPPKQPAADLQSSADLPALKSKAAHLDLPAPKTKPQQQLPPRELELPAPKSKAQPPLEIDLPAPKAKPQPALEIDLPAPKPRPTAQAPEIDLPLPSAKAAPLELDLPAPKPKAQPLALDIDLPAPKAKAQPIEIDLPAPKGRPPGVDLPLAKAKPASSFDEPPQGLSLDSPLERRDLAPSKKSFAKPSAANMPGVGVPEPTQRAPSATTLPKDSLAIDPKPFFASAPPLGMFGKLDDVHANTLDAGSAKASAKGPASDLIDLPAPQDLPAVKRPNAKATALGLGGRMAKDSLDLPAEFGRHDEPVLPEILPAARVPSEPDTGLRAAPQALSELDLPAPRDLPTVKKRPAPAATALGLGSPVGLAGPFSSQAKQEPFGAEPAWPSAPSAQGNAATAREPGLSLDLPPMSGREAPQPELDLGDFERALDNLESKGGGSFGAELDLPPRSAGKRDAASFGDLEPIALPSANASNTNQLPMHTMELAQHDLMLTSADSSLGLGEHARSSFGDASGHHGDLGLGLSGAGDLASLPPTGARGGFGELDLGLGGRDSGAAGVPLDVVTGHGEMGLPTRPARIEDAEFDEASEAYAKKLKRRRGAGTRLPGWALPVLLVGLVGGTGTALGLFTEHGYFGVYLMEQLLPAAGDPERVRAAIEQAERQAKSDTYVEVRRSLVTLSDARNEAGLNRPLLARSLLHEALYQLRFGEDAASAQRSAAILTRVLERGANVPGLTLARAADAARRNELAEAKRLLAQAEPDKLRGLVAGELALLEKQPAAAAAAFQDAIKQGEIARGQWGLARALLAENKPDEAEAAAKATLGASPRHPPAHILMGERALARGAVDVALEHARAAAGYTAIDGVKARPSRVERAHAFALEGRVEERLDHPREAQAAYELALAADPRSVPELLGSGRMLMRLGRPQDALSRFDSALNAKPDATPGPDGQIPLLEAASGAIEALLALQRPQEALPRSSALLAQFPDQASVKLWHGHVLEALERNEEAEAAFREAIEKAPKDFSGYVALSQLLFKLGRPEEAARTLSLAAGQVNDSAEVRRMLGNSELARNHLPEAIQQFGAALKFDAADSGALFGLEVAQRKAGSIDAASATLDKLAQTDPTFPGLALERGQLLENRGEYKAATEAYRAALAQRPNDSDLKLRLGAALVTAGQLDEAEVVLSQVIKERPTSAEAEHYLGRILFARNETAQAVQRFERAVNFDTLKAEYHLYLAWALVEQGNFGGALESVQHAIQRDPNLGDARWILGRIQLRTGAVRDALVNFQAALRLKPGRVEALAHMGDAYDELRDSNNAIKSYREAVKRVPENADWWYRLGQLELDKGRREEARAALSEAVLRGDRLRDRPSWLAEAHRSYGDVLRESHRNTEAAEHYRLFLELAPLGHPDRAEIEHLVYQTTHR